MNAAILLTTQVVAVSIGPKQAQDVIRHALAMGADRGEFGKMTPQRHSLWQGVQNQEHFRQSSDSGSCVAGL